MDAAAGRAPVLKRQRAARSVPKVRVYSRHRSGCKWCGDDTRLGCDCPKQLSWFRDGKLYRLAADTCDGEAAENKARAMMNGFETAAKGEPTPIKQTGMLLDEAVKTFLETKATSGITLKHVARLKFELEEFSKFALARSLVNLGDIRTEHVLAYRNSLAGAQNTRAKKIFRLIGFFRFCVEMGWVSRNPAQVQSVKLKYSQQQTPKALDDNQFETLLSTLRNLNGWTTDSQRRKLRALLMMMRWTGLAIRDAVTIERSRFEPNGDGFYKLFLRRAKTGHPVFCTLKAAIAKEIFSGSNPDGRWLFVDSVPEGEKELDKLVQSWGGLFRKLGEAAALKDREGAPYRFTSHSLRHSFVLWALNAGMPTEDVAALLGDSVEIVAAHYSEWITGRQERLNERMMAALGDPK